MIARASASQNPPWAWHQTPARSTKSWRAESANLISPIFSRPFVCGGGTSGVGKGSAVLEKRKPFVLQWCLQVPHWGREVETKSAVISFRWRAFVWETCMLHPRAPPLEKKEPQQCGGGWIENNFAFEPVCRSLLGSICPLAIHYLSCLQHVGG